MIPELSMIQALSVEGSRLDTEPSAPKPQTVEGSRRASNRALPQKKKETGVSANLPLLILFRNGLEPLL